MPKEQYYMKSRKLVSQDEAAIIESANVPRSKFINTWTRKTAFDAGWLVPILVDEVLPGDHFRYNITAYIRMSTPLFPMFDNQRIDTFFFYIPNRLVWENWALFMGEQDPADPNDLVVPEMPYCNPTGSTLYQVGSIWDHMGLPVTEPQTDDPFGTTYTYKHSALPLRAYNLIYNDWFRDQNLIAKVPVFLTDGNDIGGNTTYNLKRRAKIHDYFTSALPWPQKFTAPTVPLGGLAPIIGLGTISDAASVSQAGVIETGGGTLTYPYYQPMTPDVRMRMSAATVGEPMVFADLAATSGVAINTLRQAWLVQTLLERDARGGTRYVELIWSHFKVKNPDFRLQRPEYIGGGQTNLQLTPVAQTAEGENPVGALGAAGTAVGQHSASYAATEHGWIIGLINVRSEISYQYGLNKMWTRQTRYDFYWPALSGLGEQAILNGEIYKQGWAPGGELTSPDLDVFGYQERWHEYRTRTSEVTGIMRSNAPGTLDMWHLAQSFATLPILSAEFIADDPPMARVLAAGAQAEDQQYLADILYQRTVTRPVSAFGTPAIIGRF